jgi:hypothetical protein
VHHGALAHLLGINALRASEAAAVRIEDYAETLRGHRVLHLIGKGSKPATMPLTVPVLRVPEACRGDRSQGPLASLRAGFLHDRVKSGGSGSLSGGDARVVHEVGEGPLVGAVGLA